MKFSNSHINENFKNNIITLDNICHSILITYDLVKGLNFDFLEYLDEKYHFLFLTLLTQIFGVYFSSKEMEKLCGKL